MAKPTTPRTDPARFLQEFQANHRTRYIRVKVLAEALGISDRMIRRAWKRGGLPAVDHGKGYLMIPIEVARLIESHGLKWVESMYRLGRL